MKYRLSTILSIILMLSFSGGAMASCSGLETADKEQTEQPGGDKEDPETPEEPEQPEEPENPDDGIVRILAIGNSFSQDAVEQYLYELFDAAGQKAIIGNLYIGGCTLEKHYNNMQSGAGTYAYRKIVDGKKAETKNVSLSQGLSDEEWDYVSLQQASGSSGKYETYTAYLPVLIDYVQSQAGEDVTLMWHQTWAYASNSNHSEFSKYDRDQMIMFNAIVGATKQALNDNPELEVRIPSGTAVQNGRTSWIGDNFCRDGYHLETTYGRYTAACTWYESVSGKSVVGNSYAPSTIDDVLKAMAQNAAHLAVADPDNVTDMVDFKNPGADADPLSAPAYIDFGSSTSPSPWNNCSVLDGIVNLKDADGRYTPVSLKVSGFSDSYPGSTEAPQSNVTVNGREFLRSAWYDCFSVGGAKNKGFDKDPQGPAEIEISGLEPSEKYDFTIIGIRFNGTHSLRKVEFVLHGAEDSDVKSFLTGIKNAAEFNAVSDFGEYAAIFEDVVPDADGKVVIDVLGRDVGDASSVIEGNISAMFIVPAN